MSNNSYNNAGFPSLLSIGKKYNCDKVMVHSYADAYEEYFSKIRNENIKLLEIGIGGEDKEPGGNSLRMWRDYFPNATIYGIDIYPKQHLDGDRIKTIICDQGDQKKLTTIANQYGPFDVIIDDGCHMAGHVLASLFCLLPHLSNQGYFVIEDIQTSYWPQYGGSSLGWDSIDTPVRWIKLAVDIINADEILSSCHIAKQVGFSLSELHVYHNIAFLRKSDSTGKSNILNNELREKLLNLDRDKFSSIEKVVQLLNSNIDFRKKSFELIQALETFSNRM